MQGLQGEESFNSSAAADSLRMRILGRMRRAE
jgi:hypothetical protein